MKFKRKEIVIVGVLLEALLVVFYLAWVYFGKHQLISEPSIELICTGFFLSIPIFLINYIFFKLCIDYFPSFVEFRESIVEPLARELDFKSSFIISVAAAFGEELFFRGVLQQELGLVISSLLFALLHFGNLSKKFSLIVVIYFSISLYLGFLYAYFQNLWPVISAHFVYDFLVFLYLGKRKTQLDS